MDTYLIITLVGNLCDSKLGNIMYMATEHHVVLVDEFCFVSFRFVPL